MAIRDGEIEPQRRFPSHKIERDIGLAEYETAVQRLDREENAINWATSVALLMSSGVIYLVFQLAVEGRPAPTNGFSLEYARAWLSVFICILSFFAVGRVSELIKERVYSARKVILLRELLGVHYGDVTLVLPNWRIEGAANPLTIRMSHRLFSPRSFPFIVVAGSATFSIWILAPDFWSVFASVDVGTNLNEKLSVLLPLAIGATLWCYYRTQIFDNNENWWLVLSRFVAWVTYTPLVPNPERTLYECRLAHAELERIEINTSEIKRFVIFIEDQQYFKHRGINWRGMARMALSILPGHIRTGGSSITQQFARSNFIKKLDRRIGRKITEIFLAKWMNSVLSKEELLGLYVATVRYQRNAIGLAAALKTFFPDSADDITTAKAFFLVERLANVGDTFLGRRVQALLRGALENEKLDQDTALDVLELYRNSEPIRFVVPEEHPKPDDVRHTLLG